MTLPQWNAIRGVPVTHRHWNAIKKVRMQCVRESENRIGLSGHFGLKKEKY